MLHPIEKFKVTILNLKRDWNHLSHFYWSELEFRPMTSGQGQLYCPVASRWVGFKVTPITL